MRELPDLIPVLVIGAGVHGLSTAWHARRRRASSVLVVDKTGVAAGASGIACGVVRNNYFQPAMSELMAACVEVWESDPEALHYHGNGYIALGPPSQEGDLIEVYEPPAADRLPVRAVCRRGGRSPPTCARCIPDWRASGITVCLHEHAGGYAFNRESMFGLADKARAAGAQIARRRRGDRVRVRRRGRGHRGARPTAGTIAVEQVVVAVGPWIASLWEMLGLPDRLDVRQPDGSVARRISRCGRTGTSRRGRSSVDPATFVTADGRTSAVIHLDSDQPLRDDDGRLITDEPWGIYFKPDRVERPGWRGAAAGSGTTFTVDPYPTGTVDPGFPDMWCAALSHCLERFAGLAPALPPGPLRRRRRVHRRQLPRVRLHAAERVRRRRLEPRLQDDRRRPRDRARAPRRALLAAAPVPLRALQQRRPAPGLAQPVPLELTARAESAAGGPTASGSASGSWRRTSASRWTSSASGSEQVARVGDRIAGADVDHLLELERRRRTPDLQRLADLLARRDQHGHHPASGRRRPESRDRSARRAPSRPRSSSARAAAGRERRRPDGRRRT